MRTLLISLLLATSAAQTLPPKPRVIDKKFVAVSSLMVLSIGADYVTTDRFVRKNSCIEANPLLGPHPRTTKLVTLGLAQVGAVLTVSYFLKKRHSKAWLVPPLMQLGIHGGAAGWNISQGCY